MEINGKLPPVYARQTVNAGVKPASTGTAPVGGAAPEERVALSERAREMNAAHQAVSRMPDADLEKVARIKAQVQAGTYRPDAEETAARMLAESLLATS